MKRLFLVFVALMMLGGIAFAQPRPNSWSSWTTVSSSQITWTFPYESRDITISNDSAYPICVSLKGETIPANCDCNASAQCFQIEDSSISLIDVVTGSISMRRGSVNDASPVSVIVNY